ncbi:MAG: GtrA family protein [Bacteroidales bacterium]|jgi:putative flippase GtrA|nr:GtrA family protein [Bacteroidales bacterium]
MNFLKDILFDKTDKGLRLRSIKDILYDILISKTDRTSIQFFRGIFVGGVCVLSDMFLLYLLVELSGFHYLIANAIAFIAGTVLNYILSIIWIFTSRGDYSRNKEFIIFLIIGAVGLALNSLFMWIFTDGFEIYYMTSKIITVIIVYLWNFFSRKYILFK